MCERRGEAADSLRKGRGRGVGTCPRTARCASRAAVFIDALAREIEEEVGKTPVIKKIIPLELFISNDQHFQYNTYVLLVDREFIPTLNEEHSGYSWCDYENYPKPLHMGVRNSFTNKIIRAKLELLLDLI